MFVVVVVVVVSRVLHRKYLKIIAALHYERWRLGGGETTHRSYTMKHYKHCVHA